MARLQFLDTTYGGKPAGGGFAAAPRRRIAPTPTNKEDNMKQKLMRLAAATVLACSLCGAPARAGTPDEHVVLTPAMIQKVKAAAHDLGQAMQTETEDREDDKHRENGMLPVEYFIRSIEAKPGGKAKLAKQGLASREFGLSYYALAHGALYLGMEPALDKKTTAETMRKFTKEQQANIALLRKLGPAAYGLE
jgi:hypothetical protein